MSSEHFGLTPSTTPSRSQLSDTSVQDDDESSFDIEQEPNLDLRTTQFLNEFETEHVDKSGESENQLQYKIQKFKGHYLYVCGRTVGML